MKLFTVLDLCFKTGLSKRTVYAHIKEYEEPMAGRRGHALLYTADTLAHLQKLHKPQSKITIQSRLAKLEEEFQILKDRCS